jgi:NAD(P)-dependent dehydrogenase (short-subunit alcohol dehydrogenase family)
VTGAGSGIGRAVAELFLAQGASVAAVVVRAEGEEIWGEVDSAVGIRADLTDSAEVERMFDAAEDALGGIDIVCNVAGINDLCLPLDETSDEVWDQVVNLDLRAPFQICRRAIGGMVAGGGGAILNVGSYAGIRGNHGPSYTAAKAGLIGLTRSIAVGYGGKGVRCNVMNPGPVRSTRIEANSGGTYHAEGVKMLMDTVVTMPVRWNADAEEIAPLALFLCSDEGRHINGAVIAADGGLSAC